MKFKIIIPIAACVQLNGCFWPGVSAEYVNQSAVLADNINSFEKANNRMPTSRKELYAYEQESDVEVVSPWFTSIRFTRKENGDVIVHDRKGWFIWEQGSGTSTHPISRH